MRKLLAMMTMMVMPVAAYAGAPNPLFDVPDKQVEADHYIGCVEQNALSAGATHPNVPATDVVTAAASKCDAGSDKAPSWEQLKAFWTIHALANVTGNERVAARMLDDWRSAWIDELVARLNAKRLGL